MRPGSTLPSIKLDLARYEARDRWEAWRSFNDGIFRIQRNRIKDADRYARVSSLRLGRTFLAEYAFSGNVVRRKTGRFSVEQEEMLILRMDRAGLTRGIIDGRDFEMKPSVLTLFDFHQPIEANIEHIDYVSFMMPYSAVGYDPSIHPRFHQIPLDTPVGRTLQSNLEHMLELIPDTSAQQAITLSAGFCGLLQALVIRNLRGESGCEVAAHAREVAAKRFISENLRNPKLNADEICKSIGVSRTVLYRLFEQDGGVRKAITRQRLEQAQRELAGLEPCRGAIARVARNWGFRDQAHFSKLFRTTFGLRPSDIIGTASGISSKARIDADGVAQRPEPSPLSLADFYSMKRELGGQDRRQK